MDPSRCECSKSAMERARITSVRVGEACWPHRSRKSILGAAVDPVVRHMETAPSSEPVPTTTIPTPWAAWVAALDEDDEQVRLATAGEG